MAKRYGFIAIIIVILIGSVVLVGYQEVPAIVIIASMIATTIAVATPLTLGALSGVFCERSGVVNIGIEGMMLAGAFFGWLASIYMNSIFGFSATPSILAGVLAALLAGGLFALLHAALSITFKVDQIIGGTVINILALGLTGYFYTANLTTMGKFDPIDIPVLSSLPLVGPVLFSNPPITYAAIILVILVHYLMYHTRWGLRTRAVGEHPRAADTVGIHVFRMRYANVIIGGMIAGLAGAFLPLEAVGSFERAMTNGRGFIALAVMIFGNWTPLGALGGALLFGLASALQTQLQFLGLADLIPHQFVGMLPYLLTIIVLTGFVGRVRAPAADGKVYEKE